MIRRLTAWRDSVPLLAMNAFSAGAAWAQEGAGGGTRTFADQMMGFDLDGDGKVTVLRGDGTTEVAGYVALEDFVNPNGLVRAGGNLFTATPQAGVRFGSFQSPGTEGLGDVRSGYLEMSNVDMAEEFTSMIRAQRGLQASARIITTVDEILQEIANLKR